MQRFERQTVRRNFYSRIAWIVEFFQEKGRKEAHVSEIADSIPIFNRSEIETIYSTVDPYTVNAAKRDDRLPALFKRTGPGVYEFLGYSGDPLHLVKKIQCSDGVYRRCLDVISKAYKQRGKGAEWDKMGISERIEVLISNLEKKPELYDNQRESYEKYQEIARDMANLRLDLDL